MTPTITILSPHLDDAVLSCWHLLEGPGDVLVINVFAGVPPAGTSTGWWDEAGGNLDPADAVDTRIAEDRAALALARRQPVSLDFLDAQYRDGPQNPDVLAAVLRARIAFDAQLYAPVAFEPVRGGAAASPNGEQPHPDHAAVRDAALLLRADGYRTSLYADLPHAAVSRPRWPDDVPDVCGLVAEPIRLTPTAFERKLEAVRTYRSQIGALERTFGRIDDARVLGHEVVWAQASSGSS